MTHEPQGWNPGRLSSLSSGYWPAFVLHAAVGLGITGQLAQAGELHQTAPALAGPLGLDPRATGMLLDAMCAIEIAQKLDGAYRLHPKILPFLNPESERDMSNIVLHQKDLVDIWSGLDESVKTGAAVKRQRRGLNPHFYRGMRDLATQQAPGLAVRLGLSSGMRVLDMGGGPGVYACNFAAETPGLEAVVYDLAGARPFFEETLSQYPGARGRVSFIAGDYEAGRVDLGGRYDLVWMSQVLHGEPPAICRDMVRFASGALAAGGRLVIQEFIMNDAKDGPPFPALFNLNMLVNTRGGQAYSGRELSEMMQAAGLSQIELLGPTAPNSPAGLIQGVK